MMDQLRIPGWEMWRIKQHSCKRIRKKAFSALHFNSPLIISGVKLKLVNIQNKIKSEEPN